jgi:hypothetical protein
MICPSPLLVRFDLFVGHTLGPKIFWYSNKNLDYTWMDLYFQDLGHFEISVFRDEIWRYRDEISYETEMKTRFSKIWKNIQKQYPDPAIKDLRYRKP